MDDEIRRMVNEHMPQVARVYLAEYIRRIKESNEIELPELMLLALRKLVNSKRVGHERHRNLLTSVNALINEVSDEDKRKEEILSLYQQVLGKKTVK
jgi:hypothetical protein